MWNRRNLQSALKQLTNIEDQTQFNEFVEKAREKEEFHLVNDDVALLIVTVDSEQQVELDISPLRICINKKNLDTFVMDVYLR